MIRPLAFDARTVQDHFPGIARYGFNLLLALADAAPEREFRVLTPPANSNTRFDFSLLRAKNNLRLVEMHTPLFSPAGQWQVPRWLRREGVSLYHSPYYLMPYRTPCDSIVTVHDLIPLLFPHYFSALQRLVFGLAVRFAVRSARCVVADSEAGARDIRWFLRVPADKVTVVHAAADPSLRPAPAEARAIVRARYALPEQFVLYLGSNKPHKNLERLVRAYARVPVRDIVPLVVAGHWDPTHPEAMRVAEALGLARSIRWLGPVAQADVAALYSAATVFVFPSEYEGFGLPVLEAMACGAPVICASSSSLPEVAGNAALMLDARHVEGWSNAITLVLGDSARRDELSAASLRRAALFSWQAAAKQTHAIYRAVEEQRGIP